MAESGAGTVPSSCCALNNYLENYKSSCILSHHLFFDRTSLLQYFVPKSMWKMYIFNSSFFLLTFLFVVVYGAENFLDDFTSF